MELPSAIVLSFVTLVGLMIGSFLNAAIYRLPRQCLSLVRHVRSRCPLCGLQLAWYDNIPVVSYMALRGRCRGCRQGISWRYPAVELLTGASFAGLAWLDLGLEGLRDPLSSSAWALLAVHGLVISTSIVLSMVDIDYRILPDPLTLGGIAVAPILVFLVPQIMPGEPWLGPVEWGGPEWALRVTAALNALFGIVFGGALLYGIGWLGTKAFKKEAMGLGDVKLLAAMGGFLGGWLVLALVLASFIGAIVGILILARGRDRYLPFGPFLAGGMVLTMLWGPEIFQTFLDVTGP